MTAPIKTTTQKSTMNSKSAGSSKTAMGMGTKTASQSAMQNKAISKSNASAVKTNTIKPAPKAGNTVNKPSVNSPKMQDKKLNAKTEFAQDMTKLDDVALVSDILSTEKSLVKLYGSALTEISCEKLRKLVNTKMCECACDQFDVFLYMNERNLYPTEPAPANKVTQAKQKFDQKCKKMKK